MSRIFNRMYIPHVLCETDHMDDYRYQTKVSIERMAKDVLSIGEFHQDYFVEVDTTGQKIEYDTYHGDGYWTSCSSERLKTAKKLTLVVLVNGNWTRYPDFNVFSTSETLSDFLEKEKKLKRRLGYGKGFYTEDCEPDFVVKTMSNISSYFSFHLHWHDGKDVWYDFDVKKMELRAYEIGDTPWKAGSNKLVGKVWMEDGRPIVEYYGKRYDLVKPEDQESLAWAFELARLEKPEEELEKHPAFKMLIASVIPITVERFQEWIKK